MRPSPAAFFVGVEATLCRLLRPSRRSRISQAEPRSLSIPSPSIRKSWRVLRILGAFCEQVETQLSYKLPRIRRLTHRKGRNDCRTLELDDRQRKVDQVTEHGRQGFGRLLLAGERVERQDTAADWTKS